MLLNKYEKNVDRTMGLFLFTLLLFSPVLDMWNCCFSESLAEPWEKRSFCIAFIVIILVLHCSLSPLFCGIKGQFLLSPFYSQKSREIADVSGLRPRQRDSKPGKNCSRNNEGLDWFW